MFDSNDSIDPTLEPAKDSLLLSLYAHAQDLPLEEAIDTFATFLYSQIKTQDDPKIQKKLDRAVATLEETYWLLWDSNPKPKPKALQ